MIAPTRVEPLSTPGSVSTGLRLSLADGQRWLIRPVGDKAVSIVNELGRVMRLGPGREGRELYVAVSGAYNPPTRTDCDEDSPVVCCLPEPTNSDMRAVGMDRIAATIARISLMRGGLLLHAALAEYRGSGFAMAGPSGVGKSTASSRLPPPWHSLCDDATLVVRDRAGRWWAHPWPTWSRFFQQGPGGSWEVERAVPLRATFFLSRSPSDRLAPVNATQATALTMESAVDLAWEAYRLTDPNAAKALSDHGLRAARTLASAVPAYSLDVSLDGRFWDEVVRVLPAGTSPELGRDSLGRGPASIESLVARDWRRLVYTGASMNPTLVEPELLHVEPYGERQVRPGDVVCFRSAGDDLTVVHRVVTVGPDGIRTMGDSNPAADVRVLRAAEIIGRVTTAQRGTRRRTVRGGWQGLAAFRLARLFRGMRRRAGSVPQKLYNLAADAGPLDRLLPRSLRPRVVRFEARQRVFLKLLMGRFAVGQYDDRRERWRLSRPLRLFVDEQALLNAKAEGLRS